MLVNSIKTKNNFHNYIVIKQSDNTSSIELLLCGANGSILSDLNQRCTLTILDEVDGLIRQKTKEQIVNGTVTFRVINDLKTNPHTLEITTDDGQKFPSNHDFKIFVSYTHDESELRVINNLSREEALAEIDQSVKEFISENTEEYIDKVATSKWLYENNFKPKEAVTTFDNLPKDAELKELRGVTDENAVYVFDGKEWIKQSQLKFDGLDDVKQNLNDIAENVINKKVVPGETDNTNTAQILVNDSKKNALLFPYSMEGYILNEIIIPHQKKMIGNNTLLKSSIVDKSVMRFRNDSSALPVIDSIVQDFRFEQVPSSDKGGGTANNHAALKFIGAINSTSILNKFRDVVVGTSFTYGNVSMSDRASKYNLAALNFMDGIEKMAIENLGSMYNIAVGNRIDGKNANSHGIRFSGYGADDINTPAKGIVAVGNIINGMTNAYSLQNTAKFNSFGYSHSADTLNSIIQILAPTTLDNAAEFNVGKVLTFENTSNIIFNQSGQFNNFDIIGNKVTGTYALEEYANQDCVGFNDYNLKVKNIVNSGAMIRYPNNRLDLVFVDVGKRGVTIAASAKRTSGVIRVTKADEGVVIFSDENVLDLYIYDCKELSGKSVSISGSNNRLNIFTNGSITVGGKNNKISGRIDGEVSVVSGMGSHNLNGLEGFSGYKKLYSQTTDSAGKIIVPHGLKTKDLTVTVSLLGSNKYTINTVNIGGSELTFEVRDNLGETVNNKIVSICYIAQCVI